MRTLLCVILTLCVVAFVSPVSAQGISALTVTTDTLVGGGTFEVVAGLSAASVRETDATAFSLSPAVVALPQNVRIASGATATRFRFQTLPVDYPVSTFIGVTTNGSTMWQRVTLLPSPPFHTRFLVFRRDTGQWFLRDNADGSAAVVQFGEEGDQPLPLIFHEGSTAKQLTVYRQSTQEWFVRGNDGRTTVIPFGQPGDIPAPSDYLHTGRTQLAMFRPRTRQLLIRNDAGATVTVSVPFAEVGDHPVTNDYLGTGRGQFAVYRSSTAEWLIRQDDGSAIRIQFGMAGDSPAPGDYLGLGRSQLAVFRRGTGEWFIRQDDGSAVRIPFGQPGDIPRQGDYLALGRTLIGVARPSTGEWFFRNDAGDAIRIPFGAANDEFVPDWYPPRLASR